MHRLILLPLLVSAQPAKPFQATAALGKPAMIGAERYISGSKTILEIGSTREVTLASAELAFSFANHVESVIANGDEKLLIMRGSVRNPEKTSESSIGPSMLYGFRLWERYTGNGKFQFVAHYDADTLRFARSSLKPGESAKFIGVWRIPADFTDFRLGLVFGNPSKAAWYDLNGSIAPLKPVTAAAPGSPFALDGLELSVGPLTDPAMFVGYARDPAKPRRVVTVTATNRMLLPVRWGWQYFTVELLCTDGTAVKAYNEIIDQSTGKGWAGDLPAGATTNGAFHFYPERGKQPRAMRFTVLATGRSVEIAY